MAFDLTARIRIKDEVSSRIEKMEKKMKKLDRAVTMADGSIDKFENGTRAADRSVRTLNSDVGQLNRTTERAGRTLRTFGRYGKTAFSGMVGGARILQRSLFSVQSLLAGAGAGYAGIYKPLKLASEAEQAHIAFETMLGSASKAEKFINDLEQFAVRTPFEMSGLRESSRQLLAYGFAANDVIPMMTAIGNAASGLGMGTDGMDRITRALGQMQAKGKLSSEEMLQLTEAAIPAWDILANKMGVTTGQVMDMTSKGIIPADGAINALIDGMNERFPDMMDKQSKSLAGMWSSIQDVFNIRILEQWGRGIADEISPRLSRLNRWIDDNGDRIENWGAVLRRTAGQATDWVASKFDNVFSYIERKFLNNPDFNELSFGGKIQWVLDDIFDSFNTWYSSGGGQQGIENMTNSLIGFISTGISNNLEQITKTALKLGKALGSGMVSGFKEFAKENRIAAALLAFMVTPGPAQAKLAAAGITGVAGPTLIDAAERSVSKYNELSADPSGFLKRELSNDALYQSIKNGKSPFRSSGDDRPTPGYKKTWDAISGWFSADGSHAGGLSRVPYDGYTARLHKGEAVLTAEEARGYRNGGGAGGGFTFNGDIIINGTGYTDKDAKQFMKAIVREMDMAAAAGV